VLAPFKCWRLGQLPDWPTSYSSPNGGFCLWYLQRVHHLLPGDHTILWMPASTASNPASHAVHEWD